MDAGVATLKVRRQLYQIALVGSVFFALMALGSLDQIAVGWADLAMMSLLDALATLGHFLFAAYRVAPRPPSTTFTFSGPAASAG